MDDVLFTFFVLSFGVYILLRLSSLSEKTRSNQVEEELVREALREQIRKKKLDQLYGRDEE